MRRIVFVASLALFAAEGVKAQSAGTTIAGPFTVTLPSSQTFSFSTGFRVPTPVKGSYVLRVALGVPNGLTALSLRLNSVQVFALSDFAGGVTTVDRVATLSASNTIALQVAGARGTRITITVLTAVMPKPVSVVPNPLSLNIGGNGTLTATLAPTPTATGTLSVTNGMPSVAGVPGSVSFASGQTSVAIPVTALSGGSTIVTVSANGGQTSATVAVDTPPSVNIVSPTANSVFQAPATIQISASGADPDGSVAEVDFYQGGTLIGSATSAPYNFIWTRIGPGSYVLSAVAIDNQGASTVSAAVTVRVNAPPTVVLTSPGIGASFIASATIPLAADASDSDGTIASVTFYQGTNPIGAVTTAPYTFSWTNVGQGSYALTAVATDNDGDVTSSSTVNIAVNSGVAQIYYIVPDHLGTPRMIQDQNANAIWKWDQAEPFGTTSPNIDPDGDGVMFDYPLRFPGQSLDRETGLAYNVNRDYDSSIDRFPQSDPIGLRGGINTYLYTNNPLSEIDPEGLMGRAPGTFGKPGGQFTTPAPAGPAVPISCNGEWKYEGFDEQLPKTLRLCFCYWLCVPCDYPAAWSSNKRDLPSTWGQLYFSGKGGALKTGDDCLCKDKPGPETGCKSCPPKK